MKSKTPWAERISIFGRIIMLAVCAVMAFSFTIRTSAHEAAPEIPAVKPDTWAAVDGLGRTVNEYKDVGGVREGKYVGIFYWTWHYDFAKSTKAMNITDIINANPEARNDVNHEAWGKGTLGQYFFWDKPIFDYYINTDEYVIREHAELLADAGVDVIFFDCTNGTYLWEPAYKTVYKVFEQALSEGVNVPKISFIMNFGGGKETAEQVRNVYNDIFKDGNYKDLWFMWEGKPLLLAHPHCMSEFDLQGDEILNFFTFRYCHPSYYTEDNKITDQMWGWCSVYPQTKYGIREDGSVEQMTVNVAQNASDNGGPIAMNDYRGGVYGRGYAKGDYSYSYTYSGNNITINKDTENAYLYGLNFQQQWDYALSVDPDFIFITGWNEWVAIRQQEWGGTSNAFADQFNAEFSRDVEPSDGILKDYFYYQMVSNIRKFKGVQIPEIANEDSGAFKTVDINSTEDQWADVSLAYSHYTNNTLERNSVGWRGTKKYKYSTMRNDFKLFKIAYDSENVYFMAETVDDITDSSDPSWMHLYIDTDPSGVSPNWEGFEYIINRVSPSGSECTVEKSDGGWNFTEAGKGQLSVQGNRIQISVPRAMLGLEDKDGKIPAFNFKWTDNTIAPDTSEDTGDILDFYKYGDAAPGGRFMFSFNTELISPAAKTVDGGLAWYVWVCAAAAAAVVIAAVSVVIVTRRSGKKNVA